MLAAVTYSTKSYESARKYNVKMAYKKGKADKVFEYCEKIYHRNFRKKIKIFYLVGGVVDTGFGNHIS